MDSVETTHAPFLCADLALLEPAEWDLQTIAPIWKVRDVAAHLLDAQG